MKIRLSNKIDGILYNYYKLCFQGIFKGMEKYPLNWDMAG